MNLNIYVVCEKKYCCLLIWIFFGSQDSVGKTRMNFKETTTMLWVFFLSFCYLICLIFVLALLLNFFNVASSTRPVWSCFCRNYIVYCWFKAVDKYHFVICTKVIDIHIFWIRFCTWIGMIIMEESQHHLILFRSHLKIFEVTYQKKKIFFEVTF